MSKIAAIDIGTNSMRMLICDYENKIFENKQKYSAVTRMGEAVSDTKMLSSTAIQRNMKQLLLYKQIAEENNADRILAIATSAVRDASNKAEFIKTAKNNLGIDVQVITGKEEAELGILGVLSDIMLQDKNILVVDIGGGSTELILCEKGKIINLHSINAGAVRMKEQCIKNDILDNEDICNLSDIVNKCFKEHLDFLNTMEIDEIVGIGGTATTLAGIYHKLRIYKSHIIHNTIIRDIFLNELFDSISKLNIEQRCEIPGLEKGRADIITAGLFILKHILSYLKKERLMISDLDNLEGMVIKYI